MADSAEGLGRIAAAFVRRKVNFVTIGGWAVQAQGFDLGYKTEDIDFTPDLGQQNLERIVKTLEDLDAKAKYLGLVTDLVPDVHGLARTPVWNMTCGHGDFDLVFDPAGLDGYQQLLRSAHTVNIEVGNERIQVLCADIADIVHSKETANREKDLEVLPLLRAQANQAEREQPLHLRPHPDTGSGLGL